MSYHPIEKAESFVDSLTKEQLLCLIKSQTKAMALGSFRAKQFTLGILGFKGFPYSWELWFHQEYKEFFNDY